MAQFPFTHTLLQQALTYDEYRKGIRAYLNHPLNIEAAQKMAGYTNANQEMMDEYDVNYVVHDDLRNVVQRHEPMTWIVITEGWCGDAAFNVPMFALLEQHFPEKIKLKIFLRDRNLDMIDTYRTEGGRSIPKLIMLDRNDSEIGYWGPRPAPLQELTKQWKEEGVLLKELIIKVRNWYDQDQTATLQQELVEVLSATI